MAGENPSEDPQYLKFRQAFDALPIERSKGMIQIVSAHLVAEHYVDALLEKSYPGLPFPELRLTFEKKLKLIEPSLHSLMPEMIAGLKLLGSLRNRIAHNLHARIEPIDVAPLATAILRIPFPPSLNTQSVPDVVDLFARHVAMLVDVACLTLDKSGPFGVVGFRVGVNSQHKR
ncbi:hypothetical protein LGM96_13890 [Burkholderia gladioli]|uniref:hypothetical protein n=1 Tax=Burkholderia gladioli TaxID=28095 RepID=UPI0016401B1B|nr:hypothetical protein [Burkholderia gladioli]MCA8168431.1 hypothetical protein [Burkholderia gladioli]